MRIWDISWYEWAVPLLAACVAIAALLASDSLKKHAIYKWILVGVAVLAMGLNWVILKQNQSKSTAKELEARQSEAALQKRLMEIRAAQGDDPAVKSLIAINETLMTQLAKSTGENFLQQLAESEQSSKPLIDGMRYADEKISFEYLTKWSAPFSFLLSVLDDRVEQMRSTGRVAEYERRDIPLVVNGPSSFQMIRQIRFPDKSRITFYVTPAAIIDGNIAQQLHFTWAFEAKAGAQNLGFMDVNKTGVIARRANVPGQNNEIFSSSNPSEDPKILENLTKEMTLLLTKFAIRSNAALRKTD